MNEEIEIKIKIVVTPELKALLRTLVQEKPQTGLPDPAELDKLPWKPYKEGHRAAWIFADHKDAEELADLIRHSETQKVEIGEFRYRFSGPKENPLMFISRTPITETKNEAKT